MGGSSNWGLFITSPTGKQSVPLVSANVSATVVSDVACSVTYTLTYINAHGYTLGEGAPSALQDAKFRLRLPTQDAAVCAFKATLSGGVVLKGSVKEKEEAKEEYEKAVKQGKSAALLQKTASNDNEFEAKVGNLEPWERCEIQVTYVTELATKGHSIFLTLPHDLLPSFSSASVPLQHKRPMDMSLAEIRQSLAQLDAPAPSQEGEGDETKLKKLNDPALYLPTGWLQRHSLGASYDLNMRVAVHTGSAVTQHSCSLEGRPGYQAQLDTTQRLLSVHYSPAADMGFASSEIHVRVEQREVGHTGVVEFNADEQSMASMVTFMPQRDEQAAQVVGDFPCELFFLCDVSGSMSGAPVRAVQKTMKTFLKSLPTQCRFNIACFESRDQWLFTNATDYSQKAVDAADAFVNAMYARGGTQMYSSLNAALSAPTTLPKRVIVLTDGEAWDKEKCYQRVASVDHDTGREQVFVVGIGNGVDKVMCRRLAKDGGGSVELVRDASDDRAISRAVISLLSKAIEVALEDVVVDWSSLSVQEEGGGSSEVKQYPQTVPPMLYKTRNFVYAQQEVTPELYMALHDKGVATVPVEAYHGEDCVNMGVSLYVRPGEDVNGLLVHRLGARQRLKELQKQEKDIKRDTKLRTTPDAQAEEEDKRALDKIKSEAVELGKRWGLASSWTSFVAVEDDVEGTANRKQRERERLDKALEELAEQEGEQDGQSNEEKTKQRRQQLQEALLEKAMHMERMLQSAPAPVRAIPSCAPVAPPCGLRSAPPPMVGGGGGGVPPPPPLAPSMAYGAAPLPGGPPPAPMACGPPAPRSSLLSSIKGGSKLNKKCARRSAPMASSSAADRGRRSGGRGGLHDSVSLRQAAVAQKPQQQPQQEQLLASLSCRRSMSVSSDESESDGGDWDDYEQEEQEEEDLCAELEELEEELEAPMAALQEKSAELENNSQLSSSGLIGASQPVGMVSSGKKKQSSPGFFSSFFSRSKSKSASVAAPVSEQCAAPPARSAAPAAAPSRKKKAAPKKRSLKEKESVSSSRSSSSSRTSGKSSTLSYDRIVGLQRADGSWCYAQVRDRLVGMGGVVAKIDELRTSLGVSEDALCTLAVLALLTARFNDRKGEWRLLATKARRWLRKESRSLKVDDVVQQLVACL